MTGRVAGPSSTKRPSARTPPATNGCGCMPSSRGGWRPLKLASSPWRRTRRPSCARRVRSRRRRTRTVAGLAAPVRGAVHPRGTRERRARPRARVGPRAQRRGYRGADHDLFADRNAPRTRPHPGREGDPASGGGPRGDGGEPDDRRGDVSPVGPHEGAPRRVRGGDASGFALPRHPSGERLDVVLLGVRRDAVGYRDAGRSTRRGDGDPVRGVQADRADGRGFRAHLRVVGGVALRGRPIRRGRVTLRRRRSKR